MPSPERMIADLLGRRWRCECGAEHHIPTREVVIDAAAAERAASRAAADFPGTIALLCDDVTYQVYGRDVESALARESRTRPRLLLVRPVAEPERGIAESIARDAGDVSGFVAVGSGTVNDFGKAAATMRDLPYVCVATAASVNGFTSPIAALMIDGLKSTLPCRPPLAVYASREILAQAPVALTSSGFADLLSKPASQADWILAHRLFGETRCPEAVRIVNDAIDRVADAAAAVGRGDPDAVAPLFQALILSGFSMTIAGTSAPASGGEHLISHYWDMMLPKDDLFRRLHGLQVGVGTLEALRCYEEMLRLPREGMRIASPPDWDDLETELRRHFGPVAESVVAEAQAKYRRTWGSPGWTANLQKNLPAVLDEIDPVLMPRDRLDSLLADARAARSPEDLGLDRNDLDAALRYGRHLRSRFTVFDLAAAIQSAAMR